MKKVELEGIRKEFKSSKTNSLKESEIEDMFVKLEEAKKDFEEKIKEHQKQLDANKEDFENRRSIEMEEIVKNRSMVKENENTVNSSIGD